MDQGAVGVHGTVVGARGGVTQLLVLANEVDDVEPEAAHPPLAPEVDDPGGLGAHGGVVPVEVGLGAVEEVKVVVVGVPEALPGRAAELRDPVGGQAPILLGGAQDVVVLVDGVARQGALEPLVGGGGVVEDHVQDDADPLLRERGDELVEVLHGAHGGVDGAVVGDVVAVVPAR